MTVRFRRLRRMGIYSMVLLYERGLGDRNLQEFDENWWSLLMRISKVCAEQGMTYWIQDAAPFPTGAANGWFGKEEYKDKTKIYIAERHTNVRGPIKNASLLVENLRDSIRGDVETLARGMVPGDVLMYAVLMKRTDDGAFDMNTAIDLTDKVEDGFLQFDLPEGHWRLFLFYQSKSGGRRNYMNLLDDESVAVQIDAVYKPHYEQLKSEIGKTWNGFFYDEPEIGNITGYDFSCLPGTQMNGAPISLPWSRQMPELLESCLGVGFTKLLPCLWYNCGDRTGIVRYHYMNCITNLASANYNGQVHEYCKEHGIKYIGHVLEDENSHAHIGCGPGHFFRIEKHQDMAGIDLISAQVLPGMDMSGTSWYSCCDGDGEFYHYGLAKLASSEGHINPGKKGRSICELLALYGNMASPKYIKFMIDHLLVNGVNNFIPAGIETLDTTQAKILFDYVNRMCVLLNDSVHVAPVAVLYHGESEWAGAFQYFHKPAKVLATNQIDYDVIPCDALVEKDFYQSGVENGILRINQETYQALVVPYCERLPKKVVEFIIEAQVSGLKVFFIDDLPTGYCEEPGEVEKGIHDCRVVKLGDLAKILRKEGIYDIEISSHKHFLRYNHFMKEGRHYYLLHNEEPSLGIETTVAFPLSLPVKIYNVIDNTFLPAVVEYKNDMAKVKVLLEQYESMLFVFDKHMDMEPHKPAVHEIRHKNWRVTVNPDEHGETEIEIEDLCDLGASDMYPRYGGRLVYKTSITIIDEKPSILNLGRVCDSADVTLNGIHLGCRIASPYTFDVRNSIREGENELEIKVDTNPARGGVTDEMEKRMSSLTAVTYSVLEPVGLIGPVKLLCF